MKKFLLSILSVLAIGIMANAETVTLNMAEQHGTSTISTLGTWTQGDFTFTPAKATGATNPAFNKAGDVRIYANGTLTIECATANMTSVSFTISSQGKKRMTTVTADSGEMTVTGADDYTCSWTGDASSVTFIVGEKATLGTDGESKAGQLCFTEVAIVTGAADANAVAKPTIAPAGGTYTAGEEVEVSIACATEGATITYTIDGGEAIDYTAPFVVTESCSIVATAANGTGSKVSEEAVFTFVEPVTYGFVTKVTSGKQYLIVAEDGTLAKSATPLSGNYGYLPVVDVTPANGYIKTTSEVNSFTITETEGGYTIVDSNSKYLYQTGTYNSFNVSEELPESGQVWTIEPNADGSMAITNTEVSKYIQYSTTYTSFGSYAEAQDGALMPRLYEKDATAMEDPKTTGVEETLVDENAPVEYYNLQGMKVANPENGLFIKKQGNKATKVVL